MMAYLALVKCVVGKLKGWSINQIPEEKNFKADRLERLGSSLEDDLRETQMEYLPKPNVTTRSGMDIDEVTLGPSGMDPITAFLS